MRQSDGVHAPRDVLRAYYLLAGLYTLAASLIWGTTTLFLLDAGLSFLEVFIANAAYSAGTVVFELPTGVVADTLGRRASFLASVAVLAAATAGYLALAAAGAGVLAFSAVSVLLGLGFTFYSGAVEAWLVDALQAGGFTGDLDGVFARGQQVTGGAMLVGTLGGGALGQVDLALPFVVRVVLLLVVLGIAWRTMHDRGFDPVHVPLRQVPSFAARTAREGVGAVWRRTPARLLVLAGLAQATVFTWAFYAWPPYLLDLLEGDQVWVAGVVAAGVSVSMIVGNQVVRWLGTRCSRRSTILLVAAAVQAGAAVGVGLAGSFWAALPALLLLTGTLGVTTPVRQAYLHRLVLPSQRATAISFDSLVGSAGSTAGQVGLGGLGEAQGVRSAFVAGGAVMALALPVLLRLRGVADLADAVTESHAGTGPPSCAGHGLPETAGVDGRPAELVTAERPT